MADNTVLNSMTGGDTIRNKDRTGVKTAIVAIDLNPGGAETLMGGTMPVSVAAAATTIAKAEDVASADADVGVPAMAVRKASPANTSGADGDYEFLQISVGRLWCSATIDAALPAGTNAIGKLAANSGVTIGAVEIAAAQTVATVTTVGTVTTITNVVHVDDNSGSLTVDNNGTFAVQDSQVIADNAGFTDGTTKVFVAGYIYDEVAGTALTENDTAAARINVNRAIVGIIEDGSTRGRYATVSAANALKVDGSAVTQPVSNAGTFVVQDNQVVADNAGFTDGTTKVFVAGYIYDEVAGTALTENDAAAARVNINRSQIHILEDGVTRGRYATVSASNALKVDNSGVTQPVSGTITASNTAGDVAHDGVNSGNPVQVGCEAIAHGTNPTAVAAADRTKMYANRAGIPFCIGGHPNIISVKHTTITTAVTDAAIITVAAGAKIVVTGICATLDNASTVFPTLLVGFGTANTASTTGVILAHGGVPAGGGVNRGDGSGIIGIGADNEDLRVTTTGNATGNGLQIVVTYYTIES
jgi:hypothetical protein